MKNLFKKTLSVLLAVVMTFTITLPAFAEENAQTQTEQDVSYNGTNALGDVLVGAMNESGEANESDTNYFIQDVEIDGLTATVDLCAPDATTLVVAIYDEDSGIMTTSGKVNVDSKTETVTVDLAECEMPEYFTVKAFLLNSENAPVCNNYESIKYTEDFQAFLDKTVFDFEDDKVINLDYGYESNFAVVSDDAQVVNTSYDENIVVVDDYENGIYVFENANEEITSLSVGDVLYYVYGEGADDYILTKVGTIENNNGTVTITAADDFEISEMFSYIKIDTEQAVYEQPQTFAMARGFDDNAGNEDDFSEEFSISLTKEYKIDDNFKVSFSGELKAKFYLQFYYDFNLLKEDYYEITQSLTISFTGETEISVSAKKEFEPLVLFHGGIPIYAGIEAEVTFSLKCVFSAEISATGSIEVALVNGSRKIAGYADEDISKKPSVELKVDVAGTVAFDIIPSVSVGFEILKVVRVEMVVDADFCISGTIHILELSSGDSWLEPDKKHSCSTCVDGTITLTLSGHIDVSFGINKKNQKTVLKINLFSASTTLGDFYISIEKEYGIVKKIDFGFGRCPYIEYKVKFKAVDEASNSLGNVQIITDSETLITDANGEAECYCNDGSYSCSVSLDGYVIDNDKYAFDQINYAVHGSSVTVNIYMKKADDDSGTVTASGTCGDNLTWTLYNDGELVIDGTGGMTDYSYSAPWYSYRGSIKSVTIGNSVTTIGYSAFIDCYSLTSVTIGNGVTTIGEEAFKYCNNLTSVIIGNSVTTIGNYAFGDCYSLTSVTIGNSVTTIGYYAFAYCDGLTSVTIGNGVTTIGSGAFYDCDSLASVTIPDSVTTIGYHAFEDCDGLTSVTIGNGVTTIGGSAFYSCDGLTSVTIGNGVTTIGSGAFRYCHSLTNVTIPDSVTTIGYYAFYDCTGLTSVTVDENNANYSSDEYGVLFDKDKTELIQYPRGNERTEYIIPNSVTTIGDDAFFYCTSLTSVTIPDSVTTIGDYAFFYCTSLTNVTIPDSVTTIGDYAFQYCASLTTVYYTGTQEQWNAISIGSNNFNLTNANIICSDTVAPALFMLRSIVNEVAAYSPRAAVQSETVTSAVVGNSYVILVVKDSDAEDLLASDNLLYIDQKIAESETLTFDFDLNGETDYDVIVTNAELNHYHNYTAVVTDPTCTTGGYTTYTCPCGDTYTADEVTATGHTEVPINGYVATCTETGLTDGVKCSVCGEILTEQQVIPATGHDYVAVVTAPTCTTDGYTTYTCPCGNTYTADEVTATGHTEEVIPEKVATYTETGLTEGKKCSVCNTVLVEQTVIPMLVNTGLITESADITVTDTVIILVPEMSVSAFMESVENENVQILDKDGKTIANDEFVGTGSKVQVLDKDGNVLSEYVVMVKYDVDGNGKITPADARLALRASTNLDKIEGVFETAANYDDKDSVSPSDARMILRKAAGLE